MDIARTVKELHSELAKAKRMQLSLDSELKGLSSFERAKAQHVLERIRSLKRSIESRLDVDLPPDITKMDQALMTVELPTSKAGYSMPRFPHTVHAEMQADFLEMTKCLEAGCYRSAIILCGRLLETALHCKHYEATGKDLLEKAPGIGLGNLIAKLSDAGVLVDPGLSNQIHLINQVRVHSVHKKKDVFEPTPDQASAIVMYTLDVIRKLFEKSV